MSRIIYTQKCLGCGVQSAIEVTDEEYDRYITKREFVQDVFPHWSEESREMLISGTHTACWEKMLGPDPDAEYGSEEE